MSLLTGAHVSKILLDASSGEVIATGVEFMKDGKTTVVKAKREIILAAGECLFLQITSWISYISPLCRLFPNSSTSRTFRHVDLTSWIISSV